MKTEMYYQQHFTNHMDARTAVMEYIESWYNRRRPHSHNSGLPPATALAAYRTRCQPGSSIRMKPIKLSQKLDERRSVGHVAKRRDEELTHELRQAAVVSGRRVLTRDLGRRSGLLTTETDSPTESPSPSAPATLRGICLIFPQF